MSIDNSMMFSGWTIDDVGCWLKSFGFADYVNRFRDEEITGRSLLGLTERMVIQLFPTIGKQAEFLAALHELRRNSGMMGVCSLISNHDDTSSLTSTPVVMSELPSIHSISELPNNRSDNLYSQSYPCEMSSPKKSNHQQHNLSPQWMPTQQDSNHQSSDSTQQLTLPIQNPQSEIPQDIHVPEHCDSSLLKAENHCEMTNNSHNESLAESLHNEVSHELMNRGRNHQGRRRPRVHPDHTFVYTLPKLSPELQLVFSTTRLPLKSKYRQMLIREIHRDLEKIVPYPTHKQYMSACQAIIERFPLQRDQHGSGFTSWFVSLKDRFKNMRRHMKRRFNGHQVNNTDGQLHISSHVIAGNAVEDSSENPGFLADNDVFQSMQLANIKTERMDDDLLS